MGMIDLWRRIAGSGGETRSASQGLLPTLPIPGSPPLPDALAATHRCIALISGDMARLPIHTDSAGGLDVFGAWANRWQSAYELRRCLQADALRYGNGFAYIARQGAEVAELVYVSPARVTLHNDQTQYEYRIDGTAVDSADLLHIRALPRDNPMWGVSPLRQCQSAFTLAAIQDQTGVEAMRNAGLGKVAIIHPAGMSIEAKRGLKESYKREHLGAQNISTPLVLSEGVKVEKVSDPFGAAGWLESRRFSVGEIGRAFGVPGQLLFSVDGGTLSSVYEAYRLYVDGCLVQWAHTWGNEITRKLLPPGNEAWIDTDPLIRSGLNDLSATWSSLVAAGVATRNEARAQFGLAPLSGLDAPTLRLDTQEAP